MPTPLELLDGPLPDLDPELGDAYQHGGFYAVHKLIALREGREPLASCAREPMEASLILPYMTGLDGAGLAFVADYVES